MLCIFHRDDFIKIQSPHFTEGFPIFSEMCFENEDKDDASLKKLEFWEKLLKRWPSTCNKGMYYVEKAFTYMKIFLTYGIWDLFGVRPSDDMPSTSLPLFTKKRNVK